MGSRELNLRERQVLGIIIQLYVVTAAPVGSRYIARNYSLGLSDATIRNVMADLEAEGYISQPHTSAGRIPTDLGYRYYVDLIMKVQRIDEEEKRRMESDFGPISMEGRGTSAEVLVSAAKVLGSISRQLSVVLSPTLSNAVFEKLDMVLLSSTRMMVVLSIQSMFVKTIVMELQHELTRQKVDEVVDLLNERLSGLTLSEIRRSITRRLAGSSCDSGLKELIVRSADSLFDESPIFERLYISGAEYIVEQPEFKQPERVRELITMIEDKFSVARLVEDIAPKQDPSRTAGHDVSISIGRENSARQAEDLTIVSAPYYAGSMVGTLGILGPKRMDYEHAVRVLNYMAGCLTATLSDVN
ncbi:MAG: HrcA family transcriptional regulator [Pelodictyon luteolum]|uniref:Heat-inducible transcription repressor HrcA n=1 Tax=Pelodictyon luteolum TaxID=1100 RepID=A0A165LG24_PELLU|nr:heat-inducible transcriptional repressor HrcA [Pelodictyon luteolum]KZK73993.1 MAG: HrcA family transcriptional regulator [Pelodictyon luteolum]